jgi:hypothetical protein
MQPNNEHQYAIDYLDSISSVPPSRQSNSVSDKLFFAILGGGLLLALLVGSIFMFMGGESSPADDLSKISAKLQSLQTISDTTQKSLVSNNLRGINSTLSLTLTNTSGDIAPILSANGIDPKKLNQKFTSAEKTNEILKGLDDARLNAVLDRTYAREMTYQLETFILLLNQIDTKTKSQSIKEFVSSTRDKITPIKDRFANFNAATTQ